ncbi:hypothetical protein [Fannyhessea vaginae]|uniref:Uncharacterized protein n=1 Tax=Fannyhessea vaginae DSM 15829 TaxID=525256 RepID=F1T4F1_9ACTN|nr:hypothetical protein [Fannyhessea vaginae]EGF23595.1 hypothetical protein HMPREF0091_10542 [Fannyhessea vaginae DSM 15829]QPR41933.1 hypothetical protein I6G91_01095 [Fannyhessea vaginae]SSZ04942.1 Uncharacterised protein [Fannyhessea vaginae]
MLVKDKQEIIVTHKEMVKTIFDTSSLENEQLKLEEELNIVADKVNNCINENARKLQDQDEYEKKYTSLVNRFNSTKVRLDEIKQTANSGYNSKQILIILVVENG